MTAKERLEGPALLEHPVAAATMAVIRERGYSAASLAEIAARAGIEAAEIEELFAGKAELTLRLLEAVIGSYRARVGRAFESKSTYPENLRAAAWETARFLLDNPEEVWFAMVGVLDAVEMAQVRREEIFRWCARLVEAGREASAGEPPPPSAALITVGAVVEGLRRQQEGTLRGDPVEMVPPMMYRAVRPYLGEEAALRELEIRPPPDLLRRQTEGRRRGDLSF